MSGSRPLPFRGGGFEPRARRAPALWFFAIVLLLWQGSAWLGWSNSLFLPSPLDIGRSLWGMAAGGELWLHLGASLKRLALGWLLGTAAGLLLGTAMGLRSVARSVGMPLVSALFPIPKIALLPLFILWLGIGEPSKVATIALGVFFPTVINTYAGVDSVPRSLVRMAQSFGVPPLAIVRKVLLPGALPGVVAGFRISASIALILLVAAEMIGAEYGVGAMVLQAGHLMRTDQLLAGVAVLSVLGLLVGAVLSRVEKRLARWR